MHCPNQIRSLAFIALIFALCACAPSTSSGQVPLASSEQVPSPNLPTTTVAAEAAQFPTTLPSTPTKLIRATSTPLPAVTLKPTATKIQLPHEVATVVGGEIGCDLPAVELPVSDAQGLNEDEIAAKLADMYLDRYTNPRLSARCRIDGYQIDKVSQLEPGKSGPLEPKGDFLRKVLFSVKLIQINSKWIAYPGEIDQQNWLHTGRVIAITKTLNLNAEEVYKMEFANP